MLLLNKFLFICLTLTLNLSIISDTSSNIMLYFTLKYIIHFVKPVSDYALKIADWILKIEFWPIKTKGAKNFFIPIGQILIFNLNLQCVYSLMWALQRWYNLFKINVQINAHIEYYITRSVQNNTQIECFFHKRKNIFICFQPVVAFLLKFITQHVLLTTCCYVALYI